MTMNDKAQHAWQTYQDADCLYNEQQIQQALDNMAAEITGKLADKNPLVLSVMNGGLITAGQLLPRCPFPLEMGYLHATRYNNSTEGGELEWLVKPPCDLSGRTVLIVDDIHDVGATLQAIVEACQQAGAAAVYCAVLVNKVHDRKVEMRADFVGLNVEDRYIFGCGMDYNGYLRNLPALYAMKEE